MPEVKPETGVDSVTAVRTDNIWHKGVWCAFSLFVVNKGKRTNLRNNIGSDSIKIIAKVIGGFIYTNIVLYIQYMYYIDRIF